MTVIEMYTGAMGNGKSAIVNAKVFRYLRRGAVVGLNYPLIDEWAITYATRMLPPSASDQRILDYAIDLYERMFRFGSIQSCYEFAELVPQLSTGKMAKERERQGVQVFDECGLYFNARDYMKGRNMQFIQYFLNLRKFKIFAYFMSHSDEDIDKQIRAKVELITECRNLANRRFAGFDLSVFIKKPKFRTISIVNGKGSGRGYAELKETHTLDFDTCDLYDTFLLFKNEDMDEEFELSHQGTHPQEYYKTAQEKRREELSKKAKAAELYPKYYDLLPAV
ncbi:MAG: hypothetical protein CSB34_06110 [Desulfobulbus propionicus]|nr:MAG: hypothetical protein CSB34_06110 [Desulfobulbus propionicus]